MRNGRWGGAVPVKESREGISDEAVRLSKEMNVWGGGQILGPCGRFKVIHVVSLNLMLYITKCPTLEDEVLPFQ